MAELDGRPLYAVQRFGEGRVAVLATGSTWLWQMGTAKENGLHSRLWRQIVRSLVKDVKGPIYIKDPNAPMVAGQESEVSVIARNARYEELSDMQARWQVTDPDGGTGPLSVEESLDQNGLYTAVVQPKKPGLHHFKLSLNDEEVQLGQVSGAVLAEQDMREFRRARFRDDHLKLMAEQSGGSYFSLDEIAQLPDQIPFVAFDEASTRSIPLWHFPGFFLLLATLVLLDWYLRRVEGHA